MLFDRPSPYFPWKNIFSPIPGGRGVRGPRGVLSLGVVYFFDLSFVLNPKCPVISLKLRLKLVFLRRYRAAMSYHLFFFCDIKCHAVHGAVWCLVFGVWVHFHHALFFPLRVFSSPSAVARSDSTFHYYSRAHTRTKTPQRSSTRSLATGRRAPGAARRRPPRW